MLLKSSVRSSAFSGGGRIALDAHAPHGSAPPLGVPGMARNAPVGAGAEHGALRPGCAVDAILVAGVSADGRPPCDLAGCSERTAVPPLVACGRRRGGR